MIRVVFWKELREQFAILVALVVMGSGIIVSGAVLGSLSASHDPFDFRGYSEPARLAATVLVAVSGLVVGGMLFAGEHENGTADYFLQLPTSRWRLWVAKAISGFILTVAMTIALWLAAWAAGVFSGAILMGWLIWYLMLGIAAYAAGTFGSACTKQVLPACAIGIVAGPTAASITTLIAMLASGYFGNEWRIITGQRTDVNFFFAMGPLADVIIMWLLSYARFTNPDRVRRRHILGYGAIKTTVAGIKTIRTPPSRFGIRALSWFIRRTWLTYAMILHGFALIFGLLLLIPETPAAFLWPSMTVSLSVLAGVFCFIGDQLNGTQRFWAERSLPPGRLWCAKVLTGFAVLLSCLVVMIVPIVIAAFLKGREGYNGDNVFATFISQTFRTGLIGPGFPYLIGLLLWPIYGFAAGLLAGMCFQKPIVSCAVGLMTGAALAAMWIPSLLSGGLMGWQVWPAPVIVIFITRFMIRDWALGRIARGRGLFKLAMAIVLPLFLIAGGIVFRAFEVPECPESEDDIRFSKQLPTTDEKQPGRDLKRALAQFASVHEPLRSQPAEKYFGPHSQQSSWAQSNGSYSGRIESQIYYVAQAGYPIDRPDFDSWLDSLVEKKDWPDELAKMRGRPPGVFIDPNDVNLFTRMPEIDQYQQMSTVVLARGLQEQSRGRASIVVEQIDSVLAASRTAKHHTISLGIHLGRSSEAQAFLAVERWLERLDHDSASLKKMLAVLREHEIAPAESANSYALANQVVLRNSIRNPQSWYPEFWRNAPWMRNLPPETVRERLDVEANLLQFCWNVPWEKERLRRAIGLRNAATPPLGLLNQLTAGWRTFTFRGAAVKPSEAKDYLAGLPGQFLMDGLPIDAFRLITWETDRLARVRGLMLLVALRLYEAEKGKLPATLDELVPDFLPAVPVDPYSPLKKPFFYEISNGRDVYLKQRDQPGPPPGTNLPAPFGREEFMAAAAIGGGLVAFPTTELPKAYPGISGVSDTGVIYLFDIDAAIAVFGGTVTWPNAEMNSETRPGMGGEGTSPGSGMLEPFSPPAIPVAVAGMGGVGAASLSGNSAMPNFFLEEANPIVRIAQSMKSQLVPKGQGIIWSVGPDGRNDGGIWQANRGDSSGGDMIFLVPPAVKWQPIPGGKK